jgi:hypothetical protein
MPELPTVGDLVSIASLPNAPITALVVEEGDTASAEGNGWVRCRWTPVDARWLPREKVVVISKAYKKKQDISNKTT